MNKLFLRYLVFLGILFQICSSQKMYASHGVAVDLTYACVDPAIGRYTFTLSFYRDCNGITPGTPTLNFATNGGTCFSGLNVTMTQVSVTNVSQLCNQNSSTCNGGTNPGVQQYTYTATVTLGPGCSNLVVSWQECCRTGAITNLSSVGNTYVETVINTNHPQWGQPCNSSPQFTNTPILYTCAGQATYYNHGAVDPDGDSLAFSVQFPLQSAPPGGNIAYSGTFNQAQPLCTNNTFTLDP
jgi:hypothetical protein